MPDDRKKMILSRCAKRAEKISRKKHRFSRQDGRWTFDEFSKLVSQHACGLLDARLRPRDTLALDLEDFQLENIVSFYASALADLHVAHVEGSTGDFLAASVARAAIVSRSNVDNYFAAIPQLEGHAYGTEFRFPEVPSLKTLIQTGRDPIPGFISYEGVSVSDPMPNPLVKIGAMQTAESTLAVSLAEHPSYYSQAAFVKAGAHFGESLALNFQDRVMVAVPQNTFYGMACGIVPCITYGSLLIVDGPDFNAERAIELFLREKGNTLVVSPQNLAQLLASENFSKVAQHINKLSLGTSFLNLIRFHVIISYPFLSVLDQHSPSFRTASLQGQAVSMCPNLQVFNVAFADDRVAVGPIFQSGNLQKVSSLAVFDLVVC